MISGSGSGSGSGSIFILLILLKRISQSLVIKYYPY